MMIRLPEAPEVHKGGRTRMMMMMMIMLEAYSAQRNELSSIVNVVVCSYGPCKPFFLRVIFSSSECRFIQHKSGIKSSFPMNIIACSLHVTHPLSHVTRLFPHVFPNPTFIKKQKRTLCSLHPSFPFFPSSLPT